MAKMRLEAMIDVEDGREVPNVAEIEVTHELCQRVRLLCESVQQAGADLISVGWPVRWGFGVLSDGDFETSLGVDPDEPFECEEHWYMVGDSKLCVDKFGQTYFECVEPRTAVRFYTQSLLASFFNEYRG